jgi:class 3 adenylate cyclase
MSDFPFDLLSDHEELARLGVWEAEVYADFDALRSGSMDEAAFRAKYLRNVAIMCLDMTGFTESAIHLGEVASLQRIYDVQRVAVPVLKANQALNVRAFADDLTAIFGTADQALDAALAIHERIRVFNASPLASPHPAECAIGIGFGKVFSIGPDRAMGDEMNRASKLGEDTARGGETLITENCRAALAHRQDCQFQLAHKDDLIFPFYMASPRP